MAQNIKRYNATIVTGEYTNSTGEQKKKYLTIGSLVVFEDGGMSLTLDAYPTQGQKISFYPQEQRNNQRTHQQNNNYGGGGYGQQSQKYGGNN